MSEYKKFARQATRKSSFTAALVEVKLTLDDHLRQATAFKLPQLLEAEVQVYAVHV